VASPFTLLKRILRQKEKLQKLKYSTMQKCNLQRNLLKENQKILQDIITLKLISSFNTSQNIMYKKSSYKK
jgi:hypothetical protein